jgi:hypothetical protein
MGCRRIDEFRLQPISTHLCPWRDSLFLLSFYHYSDMSKYLLKIQLIHRLCCLGFALCSLKVSAFKVGHVIFLHGQL